LISVSIRTKGVKLLKNCQSYSWKQSDTILWPTM